MTVLRVHVRKEHRFKYVQPFPHYWKKLYSLNAEPLLSITICEGNSGAITCQNGQRIQILDATYGRRNTQTCPHRADSNTNCLSPNSLSAVYNLCNNLVSCHLAPNNGMFGGDPCGGTYKYLLVEYQCV